MSIYIVKQWMVTEREVMTEASSKAEAIDRARDGYGEIIKKMGKHYLLTSEATKADD